MTSPLSHDQFTSDTLDNGGASRHARTYMPPPPTGFMVGGAAREHSLAKHQFNSDAVYQHAVGIQKQFPSPDREVYQGSWVQGDKVTMDASQHFTNRLTAKTVARQRGEQAIYDLGGQRDIQTSPGAHKAGAHKATKSSPATPSASSAVGGKHRYEGKHLAGSHKAGAHKL